MEITTTPSIEGKKITKYLGIVHGETILGAHILKDIAASITNIIGGRSGSYESSLIEARGIAIDEMTKVATELGANAIVGVDLDYETLGKNGDMLMVTCSGTAVVVE